MGWEALVPTGAMAAAGVAVSPEGALALTAAYAAINTIATDTAVLPLKVYRERKSGGRDRVKDDPRSDLVGDSPDDVTTTIRQRQAMMGHVLGWGNGYLEITFDGDGMPTGLHLMDPRTTAATRNPADRQVRYRHSKGELPPYRVAHVAGLGFDGLTGYSPLAKAREAIGLALATEAYGASLFGNGSQPRGIIQFPNKITAQALANFRESWERLHQGPANANKTAILEQGATWQSISIPPEDAQFLATRQFQVVEIARLYRLPPHKIGDYSQSHLANIEAANLDYLVTTIAPWCAAIEQELTRKLFTREERRAGWYVEHDMRAFLRGDMKARGEFYTRLRDLGVFSPNQICEWENMNPIGPAGDIRLVPLNMVNLEKAGQADSSVDPAPESDPESDPSEEPSHGRAAFQRNGVSAR
jgi:HK97 family phage portal protein